tara:strand:+ start:479 stop:916 length:438 start_codon:yes stop_codon:yes gene_type:complete
MVAYIGESGEQTRMSKLQVDTLQGKSTAGSISVVGEGNSTTINLQQGLVKTWVSLGGGTLDVDDSFNVSSRDDDSTGQSGINMTNAFNSANIGYAVTVSHSSMVGGKNGIRTENKANGAFDITCVANDTTVDPDFVHAQCTGDLA